MDDNVWSCCWSGQSAACLWSLFPSVVDFKRGRAGSWLGNRTRKTKLAKSNHNICTITWCRNRNNITQTSPIFAKLLLDSAGFTFSRPLWSFHKSFWLQLWYFQNLLSCNRCMKFWPVGCSWCCSWPHHNHNQELYIRRNKHPRSAKRFHKPKNRSGRILLWPLAICQKSKVVVSEPQKVRISHQKSYKSPLKR